MRTAYDLMCVVARHLTGKSVRVRLTRPDDFDGLAWCDELGRSTIDVSPDLSDKNMMYVFLHELAHIRHHTYIPLTETVMRSTPEDITSPSYIRREDQADRQAKDWLEYGEKYQDHDLPYLEGILTALLTYYR